MSAKTRDLRHALSCVPWPMPSPERHTLFFEGDDLYDSMAHAIATAHRRVDLETYLFTADEIGWRIGDALAEPEGRRQGPAASRRCGLDGYHFLGMHVLWWAFWILSMSILFGAFDPVRRKKGGKDAWS